MADHELVEEHERDEFAGTSAVSASQDDEGGRQRTGAYEEGREAAHDPSREEDFRAGRNHEPN
jgi:hypothetical protein